MNNYKTFIAYLEHICMLFFYQQDIFKCMSCALIFVMSENFRNKERGIHIYIYIYLLIYDMTDILPQNKKYIF